MQIAVIPRFVAVQWRGGFSLLSVAAGFTVAGRPDDRTTGRPDDRTTNDRMSVRPPGLMSLRAGWSAYLFCLREFASFATEVGIKDECAEGNDCGDQTGGEFF